MNLDLTDPVTQRFIARLLTLTPSEWDAIDARFDTICDALPPPPPVKIGPGAWLAGAALVVPLVLLRPSPETLQAFMSRAGDLSSRALLRCLGPAWRRQGAGPVRHLVEVLTRSYITSQVRALVVYVLWAMGVRARKGFAHELRHAYAPFEPVIPLATLLPPLIAGPPSGARNAAPLA